MTTFLLVHGAWHGGWCWRKLAAILRDRGHAVLTPTLTGLGDRAHLAGPQVDLSTHVADLEGVFRFEQLDDIVFVGHSYAGLLATVLADRLGERIRRLVYLDAIVPRDGESFFDLLAPKVAAHYRGQAAAQPEPWRLPPPPPRLLGLADPADVAWVRALLVDQPIAALEERIALGRPDWAHPRRSYIYCSGPAIGGFERFIPLTKDKPGWRFHELATGHDAMITAPQALADLLLAEVSQ